MYIIHKCTIYIYNFPASLSSFENCVWHAALLLRQLADKSRPPRFVNSPWLSLPLCLLLFHLLFRRLADKSYPPRFSSISFFYFFFCLDFLSLFVFLSSIFFFFITLFCLLNHSLLLLLPHSPWEKQNIETEQRRKAAPKLSLFFAISLWLLSFLLHFSPHMGSSCPLTLFPNLNDPSSPGSSAPTPTLPNLPGPSAPAPTLLNLPKQSAPAHTLLNFPMMSFEQIMAAQSDVEANHFTLRSCMETVTAVTKLSHRLQNRTGEVHQLNA